MYFAAKSEASGNDLELALGVPGICVPLIQPQGHLARQSSPHGPVIWSEGHTLLKRRLHIPQMPMASSMPSVIG